MRQSELMTQQVIADWKAGIADELDVFTAKYDIIRQIIEEDKAMEVA